MSSKRKESKWQNNFPAKKPRIETKGPNADHRQFPWHARVTDQGIDQALVQVLPELRAALLRRDADSDRTIAPLNDLHKINFVRSTFFFRVHRCSTKKVANTYVHHKIVVPAGRGPDPDGKTDSQGDRVIRMTTPHRWTPSTGGRLWVWGCMCSVMWQYSPTHPLNPCVTTPPGEGGDWWVGC